MTSAVPVNGVNRSVVITLALGSVPPKRMISLDSSVTLDHPQLLSAHVCIDHSAARRRQHWRGLGIILRSNSTILLSSIVASGSHHLMERYKRPPNLEVLARRQRDLSMIVSRTAGKTAVNYRISKVLSVA